MIETRPNKRPKTTVYVVTHDGKKPLAAKPFTEAPIAAIDGADVNVMVVARDATSAMRTAGRMLEAGSLLRRVHLAATAYRDGYRAALRDLMAFARVEIEQVASPGPHATSEQIRDGRHEVLERLSAWAAARAPEPLYSDTEPGE